MYFGRLPIGQAMALSHELETGSNLKDNLFIDINPENRWGQIRYGGEVINAKVSHDNVVCLNKIFDYLLTKS